MSKTKNAVQAALSVSRSEKSLAKGAYVVGPKHSEGGIKVFDKSGGNVAEIEGGEAVITAPALSDNKLHEFEGKKMTKRQILSAINQDAGGVAFAKGGKMPKKIRCTGKQYKYGGEMKSDYEIVKSCGCKHSKMEKGGDLPAQSDEELAEKYSIIQRLQPIVIPKIEIDRIQAESIYKTLESAVNNYDHNEIKFFKSSFGKLTQDRHKELIFISIPYLSEIVKYSVPIYTTDNYATSTHRNILKYHNYFNKLTISGVEYCARITAYELKQTKTVKHPHHFHDLFISDIEIIKGELPEITRSFFRGLRMPADAKLINWLEKAKAASLKFKNGGQLAGNNGNTRKIIPFPIFNDRNAVNSGYYQHFKNGGIMARGGTTPYTMTFREFYNEPRTGAFLEALRSLPKLDKTTEEIEADQKYDDAKKRADEQGLSYVISNPDQAYYLKGKKKKEWDRYVKAENEWMTFSRDNRELQQRRLYDNAVKHGIIKSSEKNSFAQGGKTKAKGEEGITTDQMISMIAKLRKFVPPYQIDALVDIYRGEESSYAVEVMQQLLRTFETMPKSYQTQKQETNDKIIYLHYFFGGMDWYIVERDIEPVQYQAFGYADLGEGGEWGYISLVELMQTNRVEIDFNWTPITFGELKGENDGKDKQESGTGVSEIDKMMKVLHKFKDKSVQAYLPFNKEVEYNHNEKINNHSENILLLAKASGSVDLIDAAELVVSKQKKEGSITPEVRQLSNRIGEIIKIVKEGQETQQATTSKPKGEIIIASLSKQQSTTTIAQQATINAQIRKLVAEKGADRSKYSAADLALLKQYEGAGSEKKTSTDARILDQFFTPMDICAKMWGLAFKHGFSFPGSSVLEPAVGSGRFLSFIPPEIPVFAEAYDVDEIAVNICKVLYPHVHVYHESFESMFFKGRRHIGLAGVDTFYDLVIGNPPYREYVSKYAPLGEKEATGATTFESYFIIRGVDVLKPGGLLCYIIPNTFLSNDSKYNAIKEKIAKKADLIDAYRLPNGVFGNTDVGTDIILLKKK